MLMTLVGCATPVAIPHVYEGPIRRLTEVAFVPACSAIRAPAGSSALVDSLVLVQILSVDGVELSSPGMACLSEAPWFVALAPGDHVFRFAIGTWLNGEVYRSLRTDYGIYELERAVVAGRTYAWFSVGVDDADDASSWWLTRDVLAEHRETKGEFRGAVNGPAEWAAGVLDGASSIIWLDAREKLPYTEPEWVIVMRDGRWDTLKLRYGWFQFAAVQASLEDLLVFDTHDSGGSTGSFVPERWQHVKFPPEQP